MAGGAQHADAMIRHGQDTYGRERSPLFAEALDRKTMRMLEGDSLKNAAAKRLRGESFLPRCVRSW